jgi:WD40 repeat protein/class 3 adenylate cyclase
MLNERPMTELPAGTVTFLFTDIEGSTRLLHELGDSYAEVLRDHRQLLRDTFKQHGGHEVDTQGDSFFVAFSNAGDAVRAAAAGQRALAAHPWPGKTDVRVRMGVHTGEPLIAGDHYVGIDVHRGARIAAAAYGGQVLISARTRALVQSDGAVAYATLRELGAFPLKDLPEPERLSQLVIDGLPSTFPPPRAHEKAPAAAGLPDYSLPPADVPCPYKGLVRFEPEDSDLFFGREELVSALVARLGESPFLAVVGPSGSGKSSLVRAGVAPELENRETSIRASIIEPGEHPLATLADTHGADLILVDQFEEVFTLCRDEEERQAFVDRLLDAAEQGARVIVVLRADFYGHCAAYGRLAAALEDHQALIGPMTEEELRRAIERPAEQAGLVLEPGLAEGILHDIVGEPGALPLLSHSLLETWKRRSDRMLTLLGYLQSGGVRGAIAKTAETVYREALTPEQQTLARNIFLRLTELGEGTEDTRRRVRLGELTPRPEQAADVDEVLRVLVDARLVTTGEGTVEVAHEALIRHWPTLRAWLDEDREGRLVHRRLTEAAQEWETLGRDPAVLYRGTRLAAAADWAELHDDELNELEREFLSAAREAELSEVEATKRRNRRLRMLVAALAVFLVAALVAGAFALVQRRHAREQAGRAERQVRVATARELAAAAVANLNVDPERSVLLAREAVDATWETDRTTVPEAEEALHRALKASRLALTVRQGGGLAVSTDGRRFATTGQDGSATVWKTATGDRLLRLRGHDGAVTGIAFSRNGSRLATTGSDKTVRVWDAGSGRQIRILRGHRKAVLGLSFSPDGRWLATKGSDATVRIWNVAAGTQDMVLRGPAGEDFDALGPPSDPAFSPDGSRVASGGWGTKATIWNLATGKIALVLPGHTWQVTGVAFSPDGRHIATVTYEGTARTWDAESGEELTNFAGHTGELLSVAYSRDGSRLATAGSDATARVWDAATGKHLLTLAGHSTGVGHVAFTPNGGRLLTAGLDGTTRLWDVSPTGGRDWLTVPGPSLRMGGVAFSPDGKRFAVPEQLTGVTIRDAETGEKLITLKGHEGIIARMVFSPDGTRLAAADGTGVTRSRANSTVPIWDVTTGELLLTLTGHKDDVPMVAFSPDGRRLVTSSYDGTLRLWDAATGRQQRVLDVGADAFGLGFSPDGRSLLAGIGVNGVVTIWDAETLEKRGELRGHTDYIQDLAFGPGGRVVTASGDGTAKIWDLRSRRELTTLRGHSGPVLGVSVTPDGSRVATSSADGTAKVWDAATGRELLTLFGHDRLVHTVKISPDGRLLATGSGDGTVALHLLPIDELRKLAGERVTRNLTEDECRQYLHVEKCPAGT